MRWLDAIRTRLGLLSSRAAAEARADEEFRLHVEMETEALIRTGLTPDEARRRALVGFGGLERHKEEMRDERGARWLEDLASDLRYAGRSLRQSPGFAAVAILTLALGIGANTAIFSVMNAVLFRPLPVEGLERLVVVREDLPQVALRNTPLAPAEVLDLGARADLFERVGSFRAGGMTLTGDGDPVRVSTATTLGDFFGVFGLRPEVGRFYDPRTATQGPHGVAVISYGLWQRLAGGDPEIVGRTIRLDDSPYEIVGVLPRDFAYPRRVEILMPFAFAERWVNNRGSLFMTTIARPQAALSNEQVAAGLAGEVKRWNDRYHAGSQFGKTLGATPFIEYLAGPLRPVLLVLMGAVVFVMLIATANVASLQLVRANGRAREMTVRAAMGAGRSRLMRQLAVESLVLAAAGAVAGLTLGGLALQLLGQWPAASQMLPADVTLDRTVLAFTAAVSLIAAILFGVVPTVRASRVEPQEVLRERSRGASEGPGRLRLLRSGLVVQVALAIVLLIASGLMVRTLSSLLGTNLGFDATNVTMVKISVTRSTYESVEQRHAFFTTLLERVRGMSGVESAALMWGVPFSDETDSSPFAIEGLPAVEVGPERHAEARFVSPGLFRTLRIPLRAGRDFEATDRPGAPRVVIIDATFAEQFFPGVSPIGKRIAHYVGGEPSTIVGVVERIDHNEIADEPKATAYYSTMQHPHIGSWSLIIRSALPAGAVTGIVRGAVRELNPVIPLYDIHSMEDRIGRYLAPRRLALVALAAFAALSVIVAALGVYGVMRYSTQQRTREIGIRVALGAEPRDVVALMVRQGLVISVLGAVIGVVAALWLTRLMSGILFGVSPHDPGTFAAVASLLVVVTLFASWLPARRASRGDPVEALRAD